MKNLRFFKPVVCASTNPLGTNFLYRKGMIINMGMTVKQFNGFVRFVLDDILEVLAKMPESAEKEKLQKLADNLQKTIED